MLFLYCVVVPRVVLETPCPTLNVALSSLNLQMEGLKAMLQPCDKNTLRGILVELCAMFQRDYINVPKLHEGKLRIDHVQKMVRIALAKQRLTGGAREEDHTDPNKGIFVAGAVPNLFLGQRPSTIAHLNSLVRRCSEDTLKNTVVRLCALLQKDNEQDYITNEGPDEIEVLDIDSVGNVFLNALTNELHTVLLQQDTDRRAFAVVRGSDQKAEAQQHQPGKAGGQKQAWTGLLSVSADILALVASFLAWEGVSPAGVADRYQRKRSQRSPNFAIFTVRKLRFDALGLRNR